MQNLYTRNSYTGETLMAITIIIICLKFKKNDKECFKPSETTQM